MVSGYRAGGSCGSSKHCMLPDWSCLTCVTLGGGVARAGGAGARARAALPGASASGCWQLGEPTGAARAARWPGRSRALAGASDRTAGFRQRAMRVYENTAQIHGHLSLDAGRRRTCELPLGSFGVQGSHWRKRCLPRSAKCAGPRRAIHSPRTPAACSSLSSHSPALRHAQCRRLSPAARSVRAPPRRSPAAAQLDDAVPLQRSRLRSRPYGAHSADSAPWNVRTFPNGYLAAPFAAARAAPSFASLFRLPAHRQQAPAQGRAGKVLGWLSARGGAPGRRPRRGGGRLDAPGLPRPRGPRWHALRPGARFRKAPAKPHAHCHAAAAAC